MRQAHASLTDSSDSPDGRWAGLHFSEEMGSEAGVCQVIIVHVTPAKSRVMWSRCDRVAASRTTPLSCPLSYSLCSSFQFLNYVTQPPCPVREAKAPIPPAAAAEAREAWRGAAWRAASLQSAQGPSPCASLSNDPCPFSSGKPSRITPYHGVSLVTGLSSRVTIYINV